jgi:predicted Zn-dependent peptidase
MHLRDPQHAQIELKSGLTLVAVHLPGVHRAVIDAQIVVGSRYEQAEENGISHFLEHVLYRGTPRHPSAHDLALAFERLGGSLGAATYVDRGSLALSLPPESFDEAAPLFAEVFREPILEGIELERGIVREEILESLDEDEREVDGDTLIRRLAFGEHALGLPITGTLAHLERFDQAALRRHHAKHYVGSASVVVVAGPLDAEQALTRLSACFEGLRRGDRAVPDAPPPSDGPSFRYVRHSGSQTDLRVAFRAPAQRDADEPAAEMLLRVLDDGMSARLYHRVCDARGLCYDVSAAFEPYADSGLLDLAAETAHDHAATVLDELLCLTEELASGGPSEDELAKARARAGWQYRELYDDPGSMAELFGLGRLTRQFRGPSERLERLQDVDRENVRNAAARIFSRKSLAVVAVGTLSRRAQQALARRVDAY